MYQKNTSDYPESKIAKPSNMNSATPQSEMLDREMDEETKERAHNMDYDQPIYENMIPNKGKQQEKGSK